MDIIIAAAGKGTRLQQYTSDIPKHIIPIAGRPFLYYLLDAVVAAQFRRIIVVGGYKFEKLQAAMQAYSNEVEIIVVNQDDIIDTTHYGTACPLLAVEGLIQGDRFVYTMGDHLVNSEDLIQMQMSTHESLIATYEHAQPERFGVIEQTSDHQLQRIVEKPSHPTSQYINAGLYTLTKTIFPLLNDLKPSARGEYEITDAINSLAKNYPVRVVTLSQPSLDLGRPEDVAALDQFIKG